MCVCVCVCLYVCVCVCKRTVPQIHFLSPYQFLLIYMYIYIYIYIFSYICLSIYTYGEREREREKEEMDRMLSERLAVKLRLSCLSGDFTHISKSIRKIKRNLIFYQFFHSLGIPFRASNFMNFYVETLSLSPTPIHPPYIYIYIYIYMLVPDFIFNFL